MRSPEAGAVWVPVVRSCVRRYLRSPEPAEDLMQHFRDKHRQVPQSPGPDRPVRPRGLRLLIYYS
jgi:hypothetical protein